MGESFLERHHKEHLALEGKKYSRDQPRVPAGSSEGGQWTSGGGGAGGGAGDFSGGGYQRTGFPGDLNQSQAGWFRGEGDDRQYVKAFYSYPGPGSNAPGYQVGHGKPYKSSYYVVSQRDVEWDYDSFKKFQTGKEVAAYMKDRYGIEWDGEFGRPRARPFESPSRRMGREQISQAVRRGELTPEQAARIKF